MTLKILLADDHDLIRQGIKLVLNNYSHDLEIIECNNFSDALNVVNQNLDLDLIILDLFMPDISGTHSIKLIRNNAPCIPIVVLSSSEEVSHIKSALELGANGYVPKSSSNDILFSAINLVMSGGIYIPQQILNEEQHTAPSSEKSFTTRQIETLHLMAEGKSNKEIARLMQITEHTVKSHVSMVFEHLNANNRTQAVLNAQQTGLIKPSDQVLEIEAMSAILQD